MNQMAPIKEIQTTLGRMEKQFTSALPAQIPTRRFLRTATMAIEQHPDREKLLSADRDSLYGSCMKAAQDGLMLDNKEAALSVFNTKKGNTYVPVVQYMPMVYGLIKKALQSNLISKISAHVVYENDQFDYWIDEDGAHMNHRPCLNGDAGEAELAYAVAKLKDGAAQVEVMTREQIEKVRKVSKSGSNKNTGDPMGIWKAWPDEMWKKTVLRRLCKYLPSSSELDNVFESDNKTYNLIAEKVVHNEEKVAPIKNTEETKTRAAQIIEAQAESVIQEDVI